MSEELRFHIEKQTAANISAGMTPEEARREARLELGAVEGVKENCREERHGFWLETIWTDLCYGLRTLRKSPVFTTAAVLTLALGIGANTAIFSLVDCLVLRPLPFDHPGQLVFLFSTWKDGGASKNFSYPDFQELREQTAAIFSDVAATKMFQGDGLSVEGQSEPMFSGYASGNFFELLGVKPALGRLILPSEGNSATADPVLVLNYAYWKSRFNRDPNVVGKKVSVNGHPLTIIGVASEGFHGLTALLNTQAYMPLGMAGVLKDAPRDFLGSREAAPCVLIARLRPGVTLESAVPVLNGIAQRMSQQNPKSDDWITLRALPLGPESLDMNPSNSGFLPLVSGIFVGLAGSVLVLACINVANLLLVRAASRKREMAMRTALGATRGRLVQQLLTESVLLAALGGIGGIVLGLSGSRALSSISLHTLLPVVLDFHFDWRVFVYASGATLLTGLLVGIIPALRAAHGDLNEILHEGGRGSTAGKNRLRSVLVTAQVAGSLMLLTVAGLFLRSLHNVQRSDLGFDPNNVFNLTVDPHEAGYDEAQTSAFFRSLLVRARTLPGVQTASLAAAVPMGYYDFGADLSIEGYQKAPGGQSPSAGFNIVSPGYFDTMRIPLIRGRDVRDSDDQNAPRVAIINQAMAERYWHGLDPLGRQFNFEHDSRPPIQVIGIARNSREDDIFTQDAPFFFVPLAQRHNAIATLHMRAAMAPQSVARETISLIHSLEPAMPVFDVETMKTALETINGFLVFKIAAVLAASLGILGLLLAVVGVYGVISYAASRRTHEIGIRMACGAQPLQILKMILGQGFILIATGIITGLLAAAGAAKLVGSLLVGVPFLDPIAYTASSLILTTIALAACYIPARRAMRVDPMAALRHE
jgi:predicted permease